MTIKEIADKLSETAEAAEAAASAAHIMDEQRRIAFSEIERIAKDSEKKLESSSLKVASLLFSAFTKVIRKVMALKKKTKTKTKTKTK